MSDKRPAASRIETLRISLRPGASTITQLASALMKRDRTRAERMSVAGFIMPLPVRVSVPVGVPIRVHAAAGPQRSK
jgi:hypothetical protein